jgi:hypothetical protein
VGKALGVTDQDRLSAMEPGARELSPDVVAGTLGKRRDGLLARQLEYAWNAISEETARFCRG